MKILYFHQYFKTPAEGGAIRSYYIARALVEAGHEIIMITAHSQADFLTRTIDGITVHYLPVSYDNTMGAGGRMKAFFRYVWLALRKANRINPNLCYITSTPLTVGIIGLVLRHWRKIPYLFEVRDLWPKAPIQMGVIRPPLLKSLLYRLEKRIYQRADQLIALSPGMKAGMQQKVPGKEIHMIPNMADCDFFSPQSPDPAVLQRYGWSDVFRIIYFGALGKANHLAPLLELAALFSPGEIHVLIVGEGSEKAHLQALARELPQVSFMAPVDKPTIRELLSVSQAAYISFAPLPILQTNSPNKFFDALAAGKLMMVNVEGWLKTLVEKHSCGFYADPRSPETVKVELERFISDKQTLIAYQQRARRLAEEQFDRKILCQKIVRIIDELPNRM